MPKKPKPQVGRQDCVHLFKKKQCARCGLDQRDFNERSVGRPRIASKAPISITLTDAQREWLLAQVPEGGTLTEVVRGLVEEARQRGANARTLAALESLKNAAIDYAQRVKK